MMHTKNVKSFNATQQTENNGTFVQRRKKKLVVTLDRVYFYMSRFTLFPLLISCSSLALDVVCTHTRSQSSPSNPFRINLTLAKQRTIAMSRSYVLRNCIADLFFFVQGFANDFFFWTFVLIFICTFFTASWYE